jgi:hypothetical protein
VQEVVLRTRLQLEYHLGRKKRSWLQKQRVLARTAFTLSSEKGGNEMADTNASNEIQIRTLVENWARTVREEDMDAVLAHRSDDIVMFDVPLPLQSRALRPTKKHGNCSFLTTQDAEPSRSPS